MKGWPQNWSVNVVNMSLSCWMLCACTGLFSCIHVYTHYVYRYKKLINNSIIFILLCYFYSFFVVVVAVEPFLATSPTARSEFLRGSTVEKPASSGSSSSPYSLTPRADNSARRSMPSFSLPSYSPNAAATGTSSCHWQKT